MGRYVEIAVMAFLPFLLRSTLYYIAFRIRSIGGSVLSSCIIGGITAAVAGSGVFPPLITLAVLLSASVFLITRYTEAEIYPEALGIAFAVEFGAALIESLILPIFLDIFFGK